MTRLIPAVVLNGRRPGHGRPAVCYRESMLRGALVGFVALLPATLAAAADISTVSRGAEVRLEDHLAPGKLVLVDFYADWCGPCRMLAPRLERLAAAHPDDLALRKVDIVRWDSPVARQHRIRAVPHLRLYDGAGQVLADGDAGRVLAVLEDRLGASAGGTVVGASGRSSWLPLAALLLVAGFAGYVLLRRPGAVPPPPKATATAVGPGAGRGVAATWFVMVQGSLEGPFTREQLADLVRRRVIGPGAPIRRRGESGWRELREVLEP